MKKLTIEDKLGLDVFHTDEENSHIDVDTDYKDEEEIKKLVLACPASCYTYIDGSLKFSHLGCLECGTCRVLSHGKIVKSWNYPHGEVGVSFRQG
ncbi:MAG: ferredoxin family protein [Lachnospiraceae bacterium]|nr:ferredoxin family protein [Lachnospiraceae bacterium]